MLPGFWRVSGVWGGPVPARDRGRKTERRSQQHQKLRVRVREGGTVILGAVFMGCLLSPVPIFVEHASFFARVFVRRKPPKRLAATDVFYNDRSRLCSVEGALWSRKFMKKAEMFLSLLITRMPQ